jgi:hypothetical protein
MKGIVTKKLRALNIRGRLLTIQFIIICLFVYLLKTQTLKICRTMYLSPVIVTNMTIARQWFGKRIP